MAGILTLQDLKPHLPHHIGSSHRPVPPQAAMGGASSLGGLWRSLPGLIPPSPLHDLGRYLIRGGGGGGRRWKATTWRDSVFRYVWNHRFWAGVWNIYYRRLGTHGGGWCTPSLRSEDFASGRKMRGRKQAEGYSTGRVRFSVLFLQAAMRIILKSVTGRNANTYL